MIFRFSGGGVMDIPNSELMRMAASCFSSRTSTLAMALNGG